MFLNTLMLRQNGKRFPNIFKCIFVNENCCALIRISLKFVSNLRRQKLVQIMAWCWTGVKPFLNQWLRGLLTHICHSAPMSSYMCICFVKTKWIVYYPMLRADSRFWLVNNREIWSRISRLTSSAWDIKTKERHWWRHNGDSVSFPYRYGTT